MTNEQNIHTNANDYRDLCYFAGDVLKGKIMREQDAQNATLNGDLIKVSSYTREDGTQVDGYYRRKANT